MAVVLQQAWGGLLNRMGKWVERVVVVWSWLLCEAPPISRNIRNIYI